MKWSPNLIVIYANLPFHIEHLLVQWPAVLAEVPDAEIHLFYGWNTYDALVNSPLITKFPQLKGKKETFLPLYRSAERL
jgi:hypothetical protein